MSSQCFVFLLSKAYQRGHRLVQSRLKPYGLTNLQYLVLEMLWARPGASAAELGKELTIDKATLSGALERMSEAGWLEKRPDPQDGRMVRLYASAKADQRRGELVSLRQEANQELLAGLSGEERLLLGRLLKDLAQA
ncbi:MAG: MarR family transcriptional regulator [Desulfarculaceae bacterium]|nr:MarR family transcriptional regulator [Desulfarculaceae bacterium]MCF8074255.1 MarR family transcriptional regulator [Desulfarculaceae bacterium]MCF8102986.1 MarR family transcriptional regulator [Desulfarculaceae bacterium]MCF8117117.1 MarR family transcriptional regulator [Desulfarculaceae bacterium]